MCGSHLKVSEDICLFSSLATPFKLNQVLVGFRYPNRQSYCSFSSPNITLFVTNNYSIVWPSPIFSLNSNIKFSTFITQNRKTRSQNISHDAGALSLPINRSDKGFGYVLRTYPSGGKRRRAEENGRASPQLRARDRSPRAWRFVSFYNQCFVSGYYLNHTLSLEKCRDRQSGQARSAIVGPACHRKNPGRPG